MYLRKSLVNFVVVDIIAKYIFSFLISPSTSLVDLIMSSDRVSIEDRLHAFGDKIKTFAIVNHLHSDIRPFFDVCLGIIKLKVKEILEKYESLKINTIFSATFKKPHSNSDEVQVGNGVDYEFNENREIVQNTNEQMEIDQFVNDTFEQHFPNPEQIIDRELNDILDMILDYEYGGGNLETP